MLQNAEGPRPEVSRRTFLDRLLKTGMAVWIAGMVVPAATYLWPVRKEGPGNDSLAVGPPKDLPIGESKMVQAGGKPILVVRLGENEFRAFSAICPHLGCVVHWGKEQRQVVCPCHAGLFDTDGKVIAGPPPKALPQYPISVVNDEIRVKLQP